MCTLSVINLIYDNAFSIFSIAKFKNEGGIEVKSDWCPELESSRFRFARNA